VGIERSKCCFLDFLNIHYFLFLSRRKSVCPWPAEPVSVCYIIFPFSFPRSFELCIRGASIANYGPRGFIIFKAHMSSYYSRRYLERQMQLKILAFLYDKRELILVRCRGRSALAGSSSRAPSSPCVASALMTAVAAAAVMAVALPSIFRVRITPVAFPTTTISQSFFTGGCIH